MSATWVQALRAYISRSGAPSTLASRHHLYDQIVRVHLNVRRGARLLPDSLAVLREARWALLRDGTTREKADLLEHILKTLSRASDIVTYGGSTEERGTRRNTSAASSPSPTACLSSSSQNLSERHQLLLEQVQCLVEAKVSEIPLTARHYRYPLRSPLLAEVSPELPLLLLEELARQPRPDPSQHRQDVATSRAATSADWEAHVDCAASLAGAGHLDDALALCGEDGRMFRAVLQRVARQRQDGWRQAWALAEAVPTERVVGIARRSSSGTSSAGSYSEDWLRGVLEAVHLRARAAAPHRPPPRSDGCAVAKSGRVDRTETVTATVDDTHRRGDRDWKEMEQLFQWVDQLRRLLQSPDAAELAGERQAHAWCTAQRLVLDAYLSVCPPTRWREAVAVVLQLKAPRRESSSSPSRAGTASDIAEGAMLARNAQQYDDVVSAGRVMALLQYAHQPWMTLLFFYGDPLAVHAASAAHQQQQQRGAANPRAVSAWSVKDDEVQVAAETLLREAKDAGRLAVASGALLNQRDTHHAAVYNHAMAALAATGHQSEAMLLYQAMPVACVNVYSHWGLLQAFLQPNSPYCVAAALHSTTNYECCQRALRRLVRSLSSAADTALGASPSPSTASSSSTTFPMSRERLRRDHNDEDSFTRDQMNVWESMSLWAALRRDLDTALLCATHAPTSCRYVHLIAMIAAANEGDLDAVQRVLHQLCGAPRTTQKEVCLATAVMAVYFPLLPSGDGDAALSTLTPIPELVNTYAELTHVLGENVSHQQARLDETVTQLVDYVGGLQRRRSGPPLTADDTQNALQDVLVKAKILPSTMDLVRLGCRQDDGDDDNDSEAGITAAWRTVARVIQSVGRSQDLSVARAAPALVSAGAPAQVAIDLLPT
jgi:hypothetical protein